MENKQYFKKIYKKNIEKWIKQTKKNYINKISKILKDKEKYKKQLRN